METHKNAMNSQKPDRIAIVIGDITKISADAIVNAANTSLLGGGGVDGAIHRAAGPDLLAACRKLHGCPTGEAKITPGFNLPARFVIHTVGPVWQGGQHREAELLTSCYRHSLELAVANHLETIAFPSISTGAYSFPVELVARLAVAEIRRFLASDQEITLVQLVCFDSYTYSIYQNELLPDS